MFECFMTIEQYFCFAIFVKSDQLFPVLCWFGSCQHANMPPMKAKSGMFMSRKRGFHSEKLSKLAKLRWGSLREPSSPATVSSTPVDHSTYCCQDVTFDDDDDDENGTNVPSVATKVEAETESSWAEGRRIIEHGLLAKILQHCVSCQMPLQLINCESKTQYGLGSVLHIPCDNSSWMMVNKVSTGKHHHRGQWGPTIFDVNTKLAVGKYFVLVSSLLHKVWQHAMPHTRRIATVRHIYSVQHFECCCLTWKCYQNLLVHSNLSCYSVISTPIFAFNSLWHCHAWP